MAVSRRRVRLAAAAGLIAAVAATFTTYSLPNPPAATPAGREAPAPGGADPMPVVRMPLYTDPDTQAARAALTLPKGSPQQRAAARLAAVPQARWLTPTDGSANVGRYVEASTKADATGVLVLYGIPQRDCGSYSAGGFATAGEYRAWVDAVRAGIARRPVVVIVEPDALTSADCLTSTARAARMSLLRYAVHKLSADATTTVYLDGGHSRWESPEELARLLAEAGVAQARGFSLNVSNFLSTAEQIDYGERVSRLLDDRAHYIIDTSRNGNGPADAAPLNWCNPPGRAPGVRPTTNTAGAHADAYLWVKHPGESDGACRPGEPRSGLWFADYTVDLFTE